MQLLSDQHTRRCAPHYPAYTASLSERLRPLVALQTHYPGVLVALAPRVLWGMSQEIHDLGCSGSS